jgi:cell wall-associated hydrolases (invasion-associated proteins)
LQVIERYGYKMKNKRYAHLLAVLGITVLVNAQTLTAYAAWNTYDQSIDNQIKTVQETEQVQTTTQNKKDENPFSAGVSVVFDETMKDDDKDEDTQENVALNARSVTDTAAVSIQETLHWGYQNLGIAHVDNNLNIRQEPSENAKLVGKLTKDAACEVLSTENGWAHIKSGKVEGYCNTEYLYTGDAAIERGKEAASMIAVVNTETLKVREEPNTDSTVITLIPQEEELEVVDVMDNGWIKFLLDDEEAYVSGDYVDVEERLEKAVSITELLYGQGVSDAKVSLVQYAKQFIGNPYVWGGTSLTSGADCSGFTMSVFKKYGISLPHHAASQAQMGTKVSLADAQPGDLVFYAKNGKINHVAIYIGGGQVVHASSPKTGIKISSVNYRTPAGVRRYL